MEQAVLVIQGETEETIKVDFNPSEYVISYEPSYKLARGRAASKTAPEFLANGKSTLSLKLTIDGFVQKGTLDETTAADISVKVKKLRSLTAVNEKLHRPPMCVFHWGSVFFSGFVTSLSLQYTMFSSEGKPLRAVASLTIAGADKEKPALESPDRTKRRVLLQDMPLYMLADEVYHDCGAWRHIAIANGISNPRKPGAGIVLNIPPLEHTP